MDTSDTPCCMHFMLARRCEGCENTPENYDKENSPGDRSGSMLSAKSVQPGRDDGMDFLNEALLMQAFASGDFGGPVDFGEQVPSKHTTGNTLNTASADPVGAGVMKTFGEGPVLRHLRQLQRSSEAEPDRQQAMASGHTLGQRHDFMPIRPYPPPASWEGGPFSEITAAVHASVPHSATWTLQQTPLGLIVVPSHSNPANSNLSSKSTRSGASTFPGQVENPEVLEALVKAAQIAALGPNGERGR